MRLPFRVGWRRIFLAGGIKRSFDSCAQDSYREGLPFRQVPMTIRRRLEEARMKGGRSPGKPKASVKPNGRPGGRAERAGQGRESGSKRAARGNFPIVGIGASAG